MFIISISYMKHNRKEVYKSVIYLDKKNKNLIDIFEMQ